MIINKGTCIVRGLDYKSHCGLFCNFLPVQLVSTLYVYHEFTIKLLYIRIVQQSTILFMNSAKMSQ